MANLLEQLKKSTANAETDKPVIAIVDDDQSFSFMLKDYLLSSAQLNSGVYKTGESFLKDYKSNDNRKIILDYHFENGADGLQILRKIRRINSSAVIIIVSAQDDLEKALETIRTGATDYFLKTNNTVFANILCSLMKITQLEKTKLN